MFQKHKKSKNLIGITFSLVLSINLLTFDVAFAGPEEDYQDAFRAYSSQKYNEAETRADLAFNGFEESQNTLGMAKAKLLLGEILMAELKYNPATRAFNAAIELYKESEKDMTEKIGLGTAYLRKGDNYAEMGQMHKESARQAWQSGFETHSNDTLAIEFGKRLAQHFETEKDNQQANEYLISIVDRIVDPRQKADIEFKIARYSAEAKNLPSTYHFLKRALTYFDQEEIKQASENMDIWGEIQNYLSWIQFLRGYYAEAIEAGLKAKEWLTSKIENTVNEAKTEFQRQFVVAMNNLGLSYLYSNQKDEAERLFNELNNIVESYRSEKLPDFSKSIFIPSGGFGNSYTDEAALQELSYLKICTNLGLVQSFIALSKTASAKSFMTEVNTIFKDLTNRRQKRAKVATLSTETDLAIAQYTDPSTKNKFLQAKLDKWSRTLEDIDDIQNKRDEWQIFFSMAELQANMDDWDKAKFNYNLAADAAHDAGYLHFESRALDGYALANTKLAQAWQLEVNDLVGNIKKLEAEKVVLESEAERLKEAESLDEETKRQEVSNKITSIKELTEKLEDKEISINFATKEAQSAFKRSEELLIEIGLKEKPVEMPKVEAQSESGGILAWLWGSKKKDNQKNESKQVVKETLQVQPSIDTPKVEKIVIQSNGDQSEGRVQEKLNVSESDFKEETKDLAQDKVENKASQDVSGYAWYNPLRLVYGSGSKKSTPNEQKEEEKQSVEFSSNPVVIDSVEGKKQTDNADTIELKQADVIGGNPSKESASYVPEGTSLAVNTLEVLPHLGIDSESETDLTREIPSLPIEDDGSLQSQKVAFLSKSMPQIETDPYLERDQSDEDDDEGSDNDDDETSDDEEYDISQPDVKRNWFSKFLQEKILN